MNEKEKIDLLKRFASWLDNGFNGDEDFAIRHVDDFIRLDNVSKNNQCNHRNSVYLGDGDYQCKDCFIIFSPIKKRRVNKNENYR